MQHELLSVWGRNQELIWTVDPEIWAHHGANNLGSEDPKMGKKKPSTKIFGCKDYQTPISPGVLSMSPGVTRMDAWRQLKEKNQRRLPVHRFIIL